MQLVGSICVGDRTSCGGTVVTGSPSTDVDGRPLSRIGDRISCRHNCVIVTGNVTEIIDGSPMALHGSQTSGNCICLSQNMNSHGDAVSTAAAAVIPVAADVGMAFIPDVAAVLNEDHWVEFRLTTDLNEPIPHQRFALTDPAGMLIEGQLDSVGYAKVSPVKAGVCSVKFLDLGYTMDVTVAS